MNTGHFRILEKTQAQWPSKQLMQDIVIAELTPKL